MRKRGPGWMLPLALLLLGLAVGVLLFRAWIADVLLVRLSYYLWQVGLYLRERPQGLYWALPIGVGLVMIVVILVRRLDIRRAPKLPSETVGNLEDWAEWVILASVNPYFNRHLYRKVVRLTERVLWADPFSSGGTDERTALGVSSLPPAVEDLLRQRRPPSFAVGPEAWKLDVIVQYLESLLEVEDDR